MCEASFRDRTTQWHLGHNQPQRSLISHCSFPRVEVGVEIGTTVPTLLSSSTLALVPPIYWFLFQPLHRSVHLFCRLVFVHVVTSCPFP